MPTYTSGFKRAASRLLSGKTHVLFLGDSQSYEGRLWVLPHMYTMMMPIDWHYVVGPGGSSPGATAAFGCSILTGTSITGTARGGTRDHFTHGTGLPVMGRVSHVYAATADLADSTFYTSGGCTLQRILSSAAGTKAASIFPWPRLSTNGFKPWYYGAGTAAREYMKSALVVQGITGSTWAQLRQYATRIPAYGAASSTTGATTDLTFADTETIQRGSWTTAVLDAGNYQTSSSGVLNDHYFKPIPGTRTGYNENGKTLIVNAFMFARCASDGTMTANADGTMAGFDQIGRSGCRVTDWADNYWSQTQWQEYFTATVLAPTPHVTMCIMLGHNMDTPEQSGDAPSATWSTKYQSFISKLKAAFAAAHPTGTLEIVLIVPWFNSGGWISSTTRGDAMQAAVDALVASNNNMSRFSFYEAFGKAAPFPTLHPEFETDGMKLWEAFQDAMLDSTGTGNLIGPPRNRI